MEDHSDIGSETGNVGDSSSEPRLVENGDRRITSLSDADREAVDRLFQDGLDHENTKNLDDRETAVLQVLANLEQYPAESSTDGLVDATLAGIDRYEAKREARYSVAADDRGTARSIRLPDFFATAARVVSRGWNRRAIVPERRIQRTNRDVTAPPGNRGFRHRGIFARSRWRAAPRRIRRSTSNPPAPTAVLPEPLRTDRRQSMRLEQSLCGDGRTASTAGLVPGLCYPKDLSHR